MIPIGIHVAFTPYAGSVTFKYLQSLSVRPEGLKLSSGSSFNGSKDFVLRESLDLLLTETQDLNLLSSEFQNLLSIYFQNLLFSESMDLPTFVNPRINFLLNPRIDSHPRVNFLQRPRIYFLVISYYHHASASIKQSKRIALTYSRYGGSIGKLHEWLSKEHSQ